MNPRTPNFPHLFRSAAPPVELVPDGQLLAEFVDARSGIAFELLVRRHGPAVWAVCRRHLSNTHDAEDAFQATFLVLAKSAKAIIRDRSVGAWLYGVAYRVALKARTTTARRKRKEAAVAPTAEPSTPPFEPNADVNAIVHAELERLPDRYRLPLLLCDLEGLSRKEASGQLGWNEGTLSGRLNRARKLLAGRLSVRGVAGALTAVAATVAPTQATVTAAVGIGLSCVTSTTHAAPTVAALAKGVMRDMARTFFLKITAGILATILVLGGGLLALRTEPTAVAAPVPKDDQAKVADVANRHVELILNAGIQRELKLSAQQRVQIIDEFDALIERHELALEEVGHEKLRTEYLRARREVVASLLTRSQLKRLDQLGVQILGLHALNAPDVAAKLALTADQKKQVVQALKDARRDIDERNGMTQLVQPPTEVQPTYHSACDEKLIEVLKSLSAAQRAVWKDMNGEKATFDRKRMVGQFFIYSLFAELSPRPEPRPGTKGYVPPDREEPNPDRDVLPQPLINR
jgi:RNA polymerase sigma factor (sigma-70 family)